MSRTYEVNLEIAGPVAIWTRGDTGDSPASYPVPTYSAVKGIFESVLFNQVVEVVPTKAEICSPLVYYAYHTNYGGPLRKSGVIDGGGSYQLLATVLMNPCYRLYATLSPNRYQPEDVSSITRSWEQRTTNPLHAFQEIFNRRLKRGQCFSIPFLGWKEFTPDYVGVFREGTCVQNDVNLNIPSMVRQVFPHGLSSDLDYVYDQDVRIVNGVLVYPERSSSHA